METTLPHTTHGGMVRLQTMVSVEAARLIKQEASRRGSYFSPGRVVSQLALENLPRSHASKNKKRTSPHLDEELAS